MNDEENKNAEDGAATSSEASRKLGEKHKGIEIEVSEEIMETAEDIAGGSTSQSSKQMKSYD